MNFKLTEEHLMVRDAAREFAANELLPGVIERDNTQSFPIEIIRKMGQLGFMGIMVDPKYGGSGMDTISYVLIMEELSKIDASASVMVSVNNSLVCFGLEAYGTEDQKQKYLTMYYLYINYKNYHYTRENNIMYNSYMSEFITFTNHAQCVQKGHAKLSFYGQKRRLRQ